MIFSPFSQYIHGQSVLHALDSRTKLLSAAVGATAVLLNSHWIELIPVGCLVVLINICADANPRTIWKDVSGFWFFYLIVIMVHSIFTGGAVLVNLPLGLMISVDGIQRGLFFAVKIMLLAALTGPIIRTTHPARWTKAAEITTSIPWLRLKAFMLFSVTLGLSVRFLPVLLSEAERIQQSQRSRGRMADDKLTGKIKSIFPLIMPLFAGSLRKADTIAAAMQARGFQLYSQRSQFHPLKFRIYDLLGLIVVIIMIIVTVIL